MYGGSGRYCVLRWHEKIPEIFFYRTLRPGADLLFARGDIQFRILYQRSESKEYERTCLHRFCRHVENAEVDGRVQKNGIAGGLSLHEGKCVPAYTGTKGKRIRNDRNADGN